MTLCAAAEHVLHAVSPLLAPPVITERALATGLFANCASNSLAGGQVHHGCVPIPVNGVVFTLRSVVNIARRLSRSMWRPRPTPTN